MATVGTLLLGVVSLALFVFLLYVIVRPGRF